MMLIIITAATLLLMALAAVWLVVRKIQTERFIPAEVLTQKNLAESYRPMFRLLDESDCAFVAAGCSGGLSCGAFGRNVDPYFDPICVTWEATMPVW